jgi:hypothetical protein
MHHLLVMVVLRVVVVAMMMRIWSLEVAPVVLVPWLLLHLEVLVLASSKLIHLHALTIVLRGMHRVQRVRPSLLVGSASVVELEGGLEQERQQVDQVLRAIETGDLCLILLAFLSLLSLPVVELLVSYCSHLLWIAVLDVESVLTLEEYVPGKVFGHPALILLFEVDKGLLSARNNLNFRYFTTLTSCGKIDLEFFLCSTFRKSFDEKAEIHDRFFELEIVHEKLFFSLRLLLSFFDIQISQFDTFDLLQIYLRFVNESGLLHSHDTVDK